MNRSTCVRIDTIVTPVGVYEGECVGSVAHGHGILYCNNGSIVMGYFRGMSVYGAGAHFILHKSALDHAPYSVTCSVGEYEGGKDIVLRHGVVVTVQGSAILMMCYTHNGKQVILTEERAKQDKQRWALNQLIHVLMRILTSRVTYATYREGATSDTVVSRSSLLAQERSPSTVAGASATMPATNSSTEMPCCLSSSTTHSYRTCAEPEATSGHSESYPTEPIHRAATSHTLIESSSHKRRFCDGECDARGEDVDEDEKESKQGSRTYKSIPRRNGACDALCNPCEVGGTEVCDIDVAGAVAASQTENHSGENGEEGGYGGGAACADRSLTDGCLYSVNRKYEPQLSPLAGVNTTHDAALLSVSMPSWSSYLTDSVPGCNERFSTARFAKFLLIFLFPFFSLPGTPLNWLRVTSLGMERLFVVSGAALRTDFESPVLSLYAIALAMLCQLSALAIVCGGHVSLGTSREGLLTVAELVVPCVLWCALGLLSASYHGYLRVPHMLECHNRQAMCQLSAYAANVIDAQARVCIYTWYENGYGKVRNHHYRYRWSAFANVVGLLMSLAAPLARLGCRQPMFGKDARTVAAALLIFAATFLLCSVLTYYVLKYTDMQREILEKMRVLTNLAFLRHCGIVNRTCYVNPHFDLDKSLDTICGIEGFSGWYTIRTVVLYVSTSSNHYSRSAAMSVFMLLMLLVNLAAIAEVICVHVLPHRIYDPRDFHCAYAYGLFFFVIWGLLLVRYLYVCWETHTESELQMYVMDATSLYHQCQLRDTRAASTIALCRQVAASQDVCPHFLGQRINALWAVFLVLANAGALASMIVHIQLGTQRT